MQDLAGMRIVGEFDRRGQDEIVTQLRELFVDAPRQPRVIDRRTAPMHGYRAVHVIVFPDGAPIEIQVRTARQHEWAELFEKLADRAGRGIRYGQAPARLPTGEETDVVAVSLDFADVLAQAEEWVSRAEAEQTDTGDVREGVGQAFVKFRALIERLVAP
jgi:ppGpp synthetase/RelA/SpoT-type nucleotidyltranferase